MRPVRWLTNLRVAALTYFCFLAGLLVLENSRLICTSEVTKQIQKRRLRRSRRRASGGGGFGGKLHTNPPLPPTFATFCTDFYSGRALVAVGLLQVASNPRKKRCPSEGGGREGGNLDDPTKRGGSQPLWSRPGCKDTNASVILVDSSLSSRLWMGTTNEVRRVECLFSMWHKSEEEGITSLRSTNWHGPTDIL